MLVFVLVSFAAEAGGRFREPRAICPRRDMIHPLLGRSCWFLVGQVARGRYIAGQAVVLYSFRVTRSGREDA